jgi:Uncharacterised nucleotidyltransferase
MHARSSFRGGEYPHSPAAIRARGQAVANVLAGAWRAVPPRVELPDSTLADIAPLLVSQRAAGLASWNLLHSGVVAAPGFEQLRQAYRLNAFQSALHLQSIRVVVPRLRAAGIESVVIKGWSIARLYPKPGLRPYVDLDLVVAPGMRDRAEAILRNDPASYPDHVDILDAGTWTASDWEGDGAQGDLADHSWMDVLERSRVVPLGELLIRVLGPEDQLRLSAVHAVRHRFRRPTWLVDIGLLMERAPEGFDWAYCLTGSTQKTERVLRCLSLARHLLAADAERCPVTDNAAPVWLINSVLRRWGTASLEGPGPSILSALRQPRTLPGELYRRWPDALESTLRLNLSLTGDSRWAVQACDFVWRFGVLNALRRLRELRTGSGERRRRQVLQCPMLPVATNERGDADD